MMGLLILLALLAVFAIWLVGIYNTLVRLRNQVKEAWSQVDVQLKRRFDLVPNLIETVRGYMNHERETLESVTQARAAVAGAGTMQQRLDAEGGLTAALGRLFAVAESYPDLKANQNFLALQEELSSTENRIGASRNYYNTSVLQLNNKVDMFPSNIVAGSFGFQRAEFFKVEAQAEREAPKVDFSR